MLFTWDITENVMKSSIWARTKCGIFNSYEPDQEESSKIEPENLKLTSIVDRIFIWTKVQSVTLMHIKLTLRQTFLQL